MSISRNGFQGFVNNQPPPGVIGAFASMNPRATVLAGPGSLKADAALPVIVGNFAWGVEANMLAYGSNVNGGVLGFVANELQTVITEFLGRSRMSVQGGFPVTLYSHGDFWASVAGAVTAGAAVYADRDTGAPTTSANAVAGTGTIDDGAGSAGTTFTVATLTAGKIRVGDTLVGAGITANTKVASQVSGDPGGVGVYTVDTSQDWNPGGSFTVAGVDSGYKFATAKAANAVTTASAAIAAGTGVLTVGAMASGTIEIGDNISGTGVPDNLFVQSQLTGTPGGAGTYQLNTIGPAVTTFTATFTRGDLVKITRTF